MKLAVLLCTFTFRRKKAARHINGVSHKGMKDTALTDVFEDVNDKERRHQVVDALHVAAGRVPDGPDKQDPLENLPHTHIKTQSQNTFYREKCMTQMVSNL